MHASALVGRQEVTLEGYVEALRARFRGKSMVILED